MHEPKVILFINDLLLDRVAEHPGTIWETVNVTAYLSYRRNERCLLVAEVSEGAVYMISGGMIIREEVVHGVRLRPSVKVRSN